ncbi:MAG: carboxypeptidase-like regulatory domain-containing protein [Alistipes sp.]|nr:carboxypeptidase-like regulatory domain-containing protein [Alistipes sp.]
MKIKHFILLIALALTGELTAQNLTGKVTDPSGEPLVGASVYWAGTTVGGSTDVEGNYMSLRVYVKSDRNNISAIAATGVRRCMYRLPPANIAGYP